jgi:hypothetical protein
MNSISIKKSDTDEQKIYDPEYGMVEPFLFQKNRSRGRRFRNRLFARECLIRNGVYQHGFDFQTKNNGLMHVNPEYGRMYKLPDEWYFLPDEQATLLGGSNIKVRLNRAKTSLRENLTGYMKENVFSFHLTRCDRIVQQVFKALQIDYPSAQA